MYLIHRREEFRASKILQQRIQSEPAIQIILNTVVTEIKANEQGVCAVALKDTGTSEERELEVEGVFISVGFSPNSSLVPVGVDRTKTGYVLTDDKCETNIPGIFVAGDLRRNYAKQIVIAASEGCIAALAAARYVDKESGRNSKAQLSHDRPALLGEHGMGCMQDMIETSEYFSR